MDLLLSDAELEYFAGIPEVELVDLAIELDIPVGEQIQRAELLSQALRALADLARRDGLPLSEYDLDDLAALDPSHRSALARALSCGDDPASLVKAGRKVCKRYLKNNPRSQVPLLLPMLLPALARCLASGQV